MTPIHEIATRAGPAGGKPMPLVIASILRPEGSTGVHTHIRELCAYLDERRMPYELVTPFSWGWPLSAVIFAVRIPLKWVAPPLSVAWYRYWHTAFLKAALRRQLSGLGRAVIYAQGPEAARASIQARPGPHQRAVMSVHFLRSQAGGWVSKGHITPTGSIAMAIERSEHEVVQRLDGIVYVSEAAQRAFCSAVSEAAGIPTDVVPNFVRPSRTPLYSEPIGDLVTVGSLEAEKNHEFILRVVAQAKEADHVYTLDIYGRGALRRELERLARHLGISDQVRFRGYDPAVRQKLPAYRAYVHACAVETGPLALVEALAAGLPAVVVGKGGIKELVTDGVEGRYWPPDDPAAASRLLYTFLDDERARHTAARAAMHRFTSNLDARIIAPRLTSFLYSNSAPPSGPHVDPRPTFPIPRSTRLAPTVVSSPNPAKGYRGRLILHLRPARNPASICPPPSP